MKLIDKDALVAEIERSLKKYAALDVGNSEELEAIYGAKCKALIDILKFLGTLEVKDVDLEKEIELIKGDYEQVDVAWNNDFDYIARHFFELGLKAQKEE